jgi:hypothetical protein
MVTDGVLASERRNAASIALRARVRLASFGARNGAFCSTFVALLYHLDWYCLLRQQSLRAQLFDQTRHFRVLRIHFGQDQP